ncbi:acyl-CoA desaturase [Wenzhouxiangella marina]|uniref:Stearoyl-CoA desaturase n=1 Tax=Wenzhouxiangella marina TaxID=1579979 RepID=A0A0K0XXC1_9GAMM|nr:acyl-CoA desaturase [Wenzhouxiangella marina]AKS42277.1 stearoyl-CoA desaturase [Wenzhouxiangella marina]MBB6085950.1 stearoyl-CoA desaturase (delta-9 desaturase) [Wenzhouxiangella marina]
MSLKRSLTAWFNSDAANVPVEDERIDWARIVPFIALHLACLAVIWVGVSWVAVAVALASYLLRMFAITAFYHRYFSHRTFQTSRPVQFLFALIGAAATQRGPLWWAAHHRHHHKVADREADPHSPRHGFLWSHMGWFLSRRHFATDHSQIPDLVRYPELRLLDRYDLLVPVLYAVGMFGLGALLDRWYPELGTSAWQMLIWGYFISTVVLIHVTLTINSLAHLWGRRRYATRDDSRNNWFLALLTLGEGWHNNHHHYPGSARQGFYWWEIDLSYYLLKMMSWVGLVRGLKPVPVQLRNARRIEAAG